MQHPSVKLILYLVIVLILEFSTRADKLTAADVQSYIWWDWLKFSFGIIGAGAVTWRTFIDGSWQRHVDSKNGNGNGNGNGTTKPA